MVKHNIKVAISEQTSDDVNSKGIIEREVVRVVSPGTVYEEHLLDTQSNNYLTSLYISDEIIGISYIDVSTGELKVSKLNKESISSELARLNSAEILLNSSDNQLLENFHTEILDNREFVDFNFEFKGVHDVA